MLEELSVRDFALIDKLSVSFERGLTILTGETGAGKSLLIGAIGFLLGAKADTGVIRAGAEEAIVSGVLDISDRSEAIEWLANRGILAEDGKIVIRRSIKSTGRASAFIQDHVALRTDLADLTGLLVDLHGQHEHQSLLLPDNHRKILDRHAGIEDEVEKYSASFATLAMERKAFEAAQASEKDRAREIDFLRFSVDEISKAKVKKGEELELEVEERLLTQHERLFTAIELAHLTLAEGSAEGTSGESGSVLATLRRARGGLDMAVSVDPSLADLARRADAAYFELEDIADSLRSYTGSMRYSPERLEEIESRLAEIGKLKKKYGSSSEEILSRLELDRAKLERLEAWEEDEEGRREAIASMEARVLEEALALSSKRVDAARSLSERIELVVRRLGMPRARFVVRVARKGSDNGRSVVGPFGIDEIEFLIAPNPGEPLKALAKIASGGELSRVALAAKTVLSESDTVSTLIFDEIDAGIGGEVAVAVGQELSTIGEHRQVLCITHLASIAARADNHYRVEKEIEGGRTSARLSRVEGRSRAEEIARMLAGDPEEEASVAHAVELLRKNGNWRDG